MMSFKVPMGYAWILDDAPLDYKDITCHNPLCLLT